MSTVAVTLICEYCHQWSVVARGELGVCPHCPAPKPTPPRWRIATMQEIAEHDRQFLKSIRVATRPDAHLGAREP